MVNRSYVSFFSLILISTTSADDSAAMLKLATALIHSPGIAGWDINSHYCKWDGICCDSSTRVNTIQLSNKNLYGTLPSELSTLSQLRYLYLQNNYLSGPLPSLASLSMLEELDLGANNFSSIPQDFFEGLTSLRVVSISQNTNLAPWTIPTGLAESVDLIHFSAMQANIMGPIPNIFASLPSLLILHLSHNNLTGTLPASFANSAIQSLWLNSQLIGLSGNIDVLSSMMQLQQAWLSMNQFTGAIPDFSKCECLFDLQLRDNRLTGIIPASLISFPSLLNVSLSNNKLQGPVPLFPSNIIVVDDYGVNNFCVRSPGVSCDPKVNIMLEIASAVGYPETWSDSWLGNDPCKNWTYISCDVQNRNITMVNFSKQYFSGTISPAFANLTALRSLYLNDNNLTGLIPDSLTKLIHLEVFDISNNNLNGKIPAFSSSVELITRPGNPSLGTGTGTQLGSERPTFVGSSPRTRKKSNKVLPSIIAAIVISSVTFIALVSFMLFKYKIKRGKMSRIVSYQENENALFQHFFASSVKFSIELIRQVTDSFNENNVLGKGGFGVVYKGELHDRTKIAVKRMKTAAMAHMKGMNEFEAEIAVLKKVRHRHLVSFLGYCVDGSEGFLVYEYMPQGTLAQHLFEWRERGCPPLTWKQRVSIALDVARGVEYLHNLAEQSLSFIHRDLKPSNVLLGDDMRAKVSDFGLVKNVPDGKNSSETRVAGTFGYLAPEYAETGRVTKKVDIYAFGAILMEMITGRKAIDDSMEEEGWMDVHLVTRFRRVLRNKDISKIIDQTLNPDEETFKSICKVAELAGHCTARNPHRRPDMCHAVNILVSLVEQWKPSIQEQHTSTSTMFNKTSSSSSTSLVTQARSFFIDSPSLGNEKQKHATF